MAFEDPINEKFFKPGWRDQLGTVAPPAATEPVISVGLPPPPSVPLFKPTPPPNALNPAQSLKGSALPPPGAAPQTDVSPGPTDWGGVVRDIVNVARDFPTQVKGALAGAIQSREDVGAPGTLTNWRKEAADLARMRQQEDIAGGNQVVFPIPGANITRQEIRDFPTNAAFSVTGMAAGLGAGLGAAAVPGLRAFAKPIGMGAAGTAAFRQSSNQLLSDVLDAASQGAGRNLTDEERAYLINKFGSAATEHGLWEAIPETASQAFGLKTIAAPLAKTLTKAFGESVGKDVFTRMAKMYGMEIGTEAITQHGQHNVAVEAGLAEGPKRSFISPSDIGQSLAEVAPATILQTTVTSGLGLAGRKALDLMHSQQAQKAIQGALGEVAPQAQPPAQTAPQLAPWPTFQPPYEVQRRMPGAMPPEVVPPTAQAPAPLASWSPTPSPLGLEAPITNPLPEESPNAQQPPIATTPPPVAPSFRAATPEERIAVESGRGLPVTDLKKNPTGWRMFPGGNNDSLTLVSEDGRRSARFTNHAPSSGSGSQRMMAEAHAFAIDNPVASTLVPPGELVSQPIFNAKKELPNAQQIASTKTPDGGMRPRMEPEVGGVSAPGSVQGVQQGGPERHAEPQAPATKISAEDLTKASQAEGTFNTKAWDAKRADTIKASRLAGNTHLDQVPASVETMLGRIIYSVHDPKERGIIRTVANTGDVVVYWEDEYSADKNFISAHKKTESNRSWLKNYQNRKDVFESWLSPDELKNYAFAKKDVQQPPGGTQPKLKGGVTFPGATSAEALAAVGLSRRKSEGGAEKAIETPDSTLKQSLTVQGYKLAVNPPKTPAEEARLQKRRYAPFSLDEQGQLIQAKGPNSVWARPPVAEKPPTRKPKSGADPSVDSRIPQAQKTPEPQEQPSLAEALARASASLNEDEIGAIEERVAIQIPDASTEEFNRSFIEELSNAIDSKEIERRTATRADVGQPAARPAKGQETGGPGAYANAGQGQPQAVGKEGLLGQEPQAADELVLISQTEQEIRDQETRLKQAQKAEQEQEKAADAEAADFRLTGSDHPVDQAEAMGRQALFDGRSPIDVANEIKEQQKPQAEAVQPQTKASAPAEKNTIVAVRDVYGNRRHVRQEDLDNPHIKEMSLFNADGRRREANILREEIAQPSENLTPQAEAVQPPTKASAPAENEPVVAVMGIDGKRYRVRQKDLDNQRNSSLALYAADGRRIGGRIQRGNIAHADKDVSSTEQLRQRLKKEGYAVIVPSRQPKTQAAENRLRGSGYGSYRTNADGDMVDDPMGLGIWAKPPEGATPQAPAAKKPRRAPRVAAEAKGPTEPTAAPQPALKQETKPFGASNTIFTEDAAAKAREILRKKLGQLSAGIDPEIMQAGITLAGYYIEGGARSFVEYSAKMVSDLGDAIRPYLRSFYEAVRVWPGVDQAGMTPSNEIKEEPSNVTGGDRNVDLERNRQDTAIGDKVGEKGVPPQSGTATRRRRTGATGSARSRGSAAGGRGVLGNEAVPPGTKSDSALPEEASGMEGSFPGDNERERSGNTGLDGPPVEPTTTAQTDSVATERTDAVANRKAQEEAGNIKIEPGNKENIRETLPFLYAGQQDDVHFAEKRFEKPNGYGVLFTNGTGTGKTYTGLGIIKRFERQGKTNILIVTPSQGIGKVWSAEGKNLGLDITPLADTKDSGKGIVVTTYANLGQNSALASRTWDLVIADEAHKLTRNEEGNSTQALDALRAITLHPDGAFNRHAALHKELFEQEKNTSQALKEAKKLGWLHAPGSPEFARYHGDVSKLESELNPIQEKIQETRNQVNEEVKAAQGERRTRVVFLSATPFAYEKAITYANGYLFDYPQVDSSRYNSGSGYDRFMMEHFGYRMRYNKLTAPEAGVNLGLMQRRFNSWLKTNNVLSSRKLDVPYDYDRKFVLVESAIGQEIDRALDWLGDKYDSGGPYHEIGKHIESQFDHQGRRYLLEAIKAKESIPIIKEHLSLGRKVVVFHDFKKGGGFNPFHLTKKRDDADYNKAVDAFHSAFPTLAENPIWLAHSPINELTAAFPQAKLYNGDVASKNRSEAIRLFNDDNSGVDLIIGQADAMQEGVSLHDTTGKHPRVLINLGLPTTPTTTLQQEGRIYRIGQKSNAMFRYLNTGTNWERTAFAVTIATRTSAVENMSSGEEARALMDAYINGFTESDAYPAGFAGEGTGGKATDALANAALTEFDRAVSAYFSNQKRTSRNKSLEGADYYATPEPVGLKMVELADIKSGESVLEPSAGHGAIAMWFPETASRTVIEPSAELSGKLRLRVPGEHLRVIDGRFEDLDIGANKYDAIIMNPPFGVGGKLAMDHLEKAAQHLRDGGRIVALLPRGTMADRRFDEWMFGEKTKDKKSSDNVYLVADFDLPRVTFERAGTSVSSHIVVLEKQTNEDAAKKIQPAVKRDLTDIESIKELFSKIGTMNVPPRVKAEKQSETVASKEESPATKNVPDTGDKFKLAQTTHAIKKIPLFVATAANRLSSDDYRKVEALAKKHGGYYSPYNRNGAVPGFQFTSEATRQAFLDDANQAANNGDVRFSLSGRGEGMPVSEVERHVGAIPLLKSLNVPVLVRGAESDLPRAVQREIRRQNADGSVSAVFHGGSVYLVAQNLSTAAEIEEAVLHEIAHVGVRKLYGPDGIQALRAIHQAVGGDEGIRALAKSHGFDMEAYFKAAETAYANDPLGRRVMLADELLAHLAQRGPKSLPAKIVMALRQFVGAVRSWLREQGFDAWLREKGWADLSQWNDADLAHELRRIMEAAKGDAKRAPGGTRFLFAGKQAKTADQKSREFARRFSLAGHDEEHTRKMTGWHQGADGEWRFEIDDSQARLLQPRNDIERLKQGLSVLGPLGGLLEHKELFAAYPHLARLWVRIVPGMQGGSFDSTNRVIKIGWSSDENPLSPLLHEIQHAIQDVEVFARGGSVDAILYSLDDSPNSNEAISDAVSSEMGKEDIKEILDNAKQAKKNEDWQAERTLIFKAKYLAAYRVYSRLAGEVEARNVQARLDFTAKERVGIPPSFTEPVPLSQQIVMFRNKLGESGLIPFHKEETASASKTQEVVDYEADMAAQTAILAEAAVKSGYKTIDEWAQAQTTRFMEEAARWRDDHPMRFSIAASMTRSPQSLGGMADSVRDAISDWISYPGSDTRPKWWDKTVGSMRNLARRSPEFKRVLDIIEQAHWDATRLASAPEKLAPLWFRDLSGGIRQAIKTGNLSTADQKIVSDALNAITTGEKRRHDISTPQGKAALAKHGITTDTQLQAYDQAMKAIELATDQSARALSVRIGQASYLDYGMLSALFDKSQDLNELNQDLSDWIRGGPTFPSIIGQDRKGNPVFSIHWLEEAKKTNELEVARLQAAKAQAEDIQPYLDQIEALDKSLEDHKTLLERLRDVKDRAGKLKFEGYVPLMRFGKYTVTAVDANGKHQPDLPFLMFETRNEANRAARELRGKGFTIRQETMNPDQWKMFEGISPEAMSAFADLLPKGMQEVMQQWIKHAVADSSAMKRMLHRNEVPGWYPDAQRVIAQYLVSTARLASRNLHSVATDQALRDIKQGDTQQQAQRLIEYMKNPEEEFSGLRNFLFFWYLGGSISSAITNLTQPILTTIPKLSTYGIAAPAVVAKWMAKAPTGVVPKKYQADFQRGVDEGVISPQETYNLMATARGGAFGGGKMMRSRPVQIGMVAWGSLFARAEQFNRRVTFLSALEMVENDPSILKKAGVASAYEFAKKMVDDTQFVYARWNRMAWARGKGAPLFTFKQFTLQYAEFLMSLPLPQRALALGLLALAAGLTGLPGEEDAEDVIDTIGQWLGYPTNSRAWLKTYVPSIVLNGLQDLGLPFDIQSRLGLGNMAPGTGAMIPSNTNRARDVSEVFGPAGSLVSNAVQATAAAVKGDISGAFSLMAPRAVSSGLKGYDMAMTGMARDRAGNKVDDVTGFETAMQFANFTPRRVAETYETSRVNQEIKDYQQMRESSLVTRIARARVEGDETALQKAKDEWESWNESHPDRPIVITQAQIRKRIRDMLTDKEARVIRSMPREIRRLGAEMYGEEGEED